jgi:transcriptional regulator with XRE-family HTH domain
MALWVDEPLQNTIRAELERRDMSISDLARAIGSQPSLVSRWMQGQRPNTESVALIADAPGLDVLHLLELAGHIPPGVVRRERDEWLTTLITTLDQMEWSEERYLFLRHTLDWMRANPPDKLQYESLTTPGITH